MRTCVSGMTDGAVCAAMLRCLGRPEPPSEPAQATHVRLPPDAEVDRLRGPKTGWQPVHFRDADRDQACLVSQKILSISAILSSSFCATSASSEPFAPEAPASLVASLNRPCSSGYFSKCGGLK